MIAAYCSMFGLAGRVLRFGNVVGPMQTHGVGFDFVRLARRQADGFLQILDREVELPDGDVAVPAVTIDARIVRIEPEPAGVDLDGFPEFAEVGSPSPEPDDGFGARFAFREIESGGDVGLELRARRLGHGWPVERLAEKRRRFGTVRRLLPERHVNNLRPRVSF